ncbi:C6 transcription factor [Penicillium cinerascens]|uniref:C6 transcription factor n=1 Tax=Penicillium cinerascens TaxID=70096 RepID=A0A9W9N1P6_9EURO|nr:C6 transcription factor [Penicillium cinerascens]KAJ5211558.1 C6 transcription factor [Penicillium cinerascens]
MESPSSVSTRIEENEPNWQYGPRAAKRRKRASTAGASRPSPREIGFMRESQNYGSATFLGSSSGIHFIRHVYSAFARRSADLQQNRARDRSSVPGEDDRLRRGSGSSRDTEEIWLKEELSFAPNASFSFENLVNWTRCYFENWHPIFPCLHAPTILKAMETLSHQGLSGASRLDMIVIRSLVSISLADSRQVEGPEANLGPVPATLVFQSVNHVMHDIQNLLTEPTTIPLLQAAFCAQLTLTSLLRLNAASRVGGVITRTAFHLGLHRCPGRFPCFSSQEVDIRRRLFWSIYSLERYLSQALGIPLGIRDDDIDVCYPGEERHATLTPEAFHNQRLRLLCHLAKFSRIRGLILELRNKSILHSHAGTVEAAHVNGELSQWWNEVYDDVNSIEDHADTEPGQDPVLAPYHRLLLIVLRHEAIISMNRPLLAAEKPNPDYKNALQTCIASSRSLLTALNKYMSSASDAPLTWPSFTWTTWMACLILLYAAWEGEFPVATALRYGRLGISVLQNLALRGSGWPETCIEAIRSMESALSTNQSSGNHENATGMALDDRNALQHRPGTPGKGTARAMNGSQIQNRGHQSAGINMTPGRSTPPENANADYQDVSPSVDTQQFEPPTGSALRGVDPGEQYNSAIFSTPNPGIGMDMNPNDGTHWNGQTSAGLIFGNMVNSNAAFNPGILGQDILPFSDQSLVMGDLWSVADGPWMIHGNML